MDSHSEYPGDDGAPSDASGGGLLGGLVKLARPNQWAKGVFVLIGPFFALADGKLADVAKLDVVSAAALAFFGFCLAASGCYVFNDLADVDRDRLHPRKRLRPIASGRVSPGIAKVYGLVLFACGLGCSLLVPGGLKWWVLGLIAFYIVNVSCYSWGLKRLIVVDVISLSTGFVIRVLGGCAAVGVSPSTWLLNVTLFLAMFLAVGKRLGERQSMGEGAGETRAVQKKYSLELLRMLSVVTAVATLLTYAQYVQAKDTIYTVTLHAVGDRGFGFNLLWITLLPAVYGLMRALVQLERGVFDDPTEMATKDRPFQLAAGAFVLVTVLLTWMRLG